MALIPSFQERRLWGTDVYTDDSDIIALLVHSSFLRPVEEVPPTDESMQAFKGNKVDADDLRVTLRVAPKLVRYVATERGGIESRGWGNSHDGVSLCVEGVARLKPGQVIGRARRTAKSRLAGLDIERRVALGSAWSAGSGPVMNEITFLRNGDVGYRYCAETLLASLHAPDLDPPEQGPRLWPKIWTHDLIMENDTEMWTLQGRQNYDKNFTFLNLAIFRTFLADSFVSPVATAPSQPPSKVAGPLPAATETIVALIYITDVDFIPGGMFLKDRSAWTDAEEVERGDLSAIKAYRWRPVEERPSTGY